MKKAIVGVFVILLVSCVTWKLERRLPKDISAWYDIHKYIMQAQVPEFVSQKKMTEAVYFLRLTEMQKRAYLKIFWDIRFLDAQDEFKLRQKIANVAFANEGIKGWRTDQGLLMLQCGQPDYVDEFTPTGQPFAGNVDWEEDAIVRIWRYWWGSGFVARLIEFRFTWTTRDRTWRADRIYDIDQIQFIRYQQLLMSPTEDGWQRWLAVMP